MPPPIRVELVPHDPRWAQAARERAAALAAAIGPTLVAVHHIGSTAIAGVHAKPVLDLMPVVRGLDALDARRAAVEALGYRWWGEYGLPGRRYCTLSEAGDGRRLVHAHCYEHGSAEAERHLAFRDYLRAHPRVPSGGFARLLRLQARVDTRRAGARAALAERGMKARRRPRRRRNARLTSARPGRPRCTARSALSSPSSAAP